MAKRSRSKEIWHFPKRGSVHQTIFMVSVLARQKFNGKVWNYSKQEAVATEMGKAGLTLKGGSITNQSVRTLLANIPKFLGFVYIDQSERQGRIVVTDVGYRLMNSHDLSGIAPHRNLSEYEKAGDLVETSAIFREQMGKLIITNPSIKKDCDNILLFPFRLTLRLLLEMSYMDVEEIAYILFHTGVESEYNSLVERINNFRKIKSAERDSIINSYRQTEEGNLTLVKAPSAQYYMTLCCSTGLCIRSRERTGNMSKSLPVLRLADRDQAERFLERYADMKPYDFGDDWFLWKEYFTVPERIHPPFDAVVLCDAERDMLITVRREKMTLYSGLLSNTEKFTFPAFPAEPYELTVYELSTGNRFFHEDVTFSNPDVPFEIRENNSSLGNGVTSQDLVERISQMSSRQHGGFDEDYRIKLMTLRDVLGRNYMDNRRKGGRLEYLFNELLRNSRDAGAIDEISWHGRLGKYGICEPAPGGKQGLPDITFRIGDTLFVLELTTIRDVRAQWAGSEASSVPDHVTRIHRENPQKEVIGIFSAPSIHRQLEVNLTSVAVREKVPILFYKCNDLAELIASGDRSMIMNELTSAARSFPGP